MATGELLVKLEDIFSIDPLDAMKYISTHLPQSKMFQTIFLSRRTFFSYLIILLCSRVDVYTDNKFSLIGKLLTTIDIPISTFPFQKNPTWSKISHRNIACSNLTIIYLFLHTPIYCFGIVLLHYFLSEYLYFFLNLRYQKC